MTKTSKSQNSNGKPSTESKSKSQTNGQPQPNGQPDLEQAAEAAAPKPDVHVEHTTAEQPDADFARINLQNLAGYEAPERAFLSLYLSGPDAVERISDQAERVRNVLAGQDDELEHFENSLQMVREWLEENPFKTKGLVVFACWALDLVRGFPLAVSPPDRLWLGSSPFIRPLAELQDEYETFAVVAADNRATRIYLVSSTLVAEEERVRGDVKNRVKKGGWSQKRYARRRKEQLHHYADEVVEVLHKMSEEKQFDRIVLLGQKEAMEEIAASLPESLKGRLLKPRRIDVEEDREGLMDEALEVFTEGEREDEAHLWHRIQEEALGHGLAALGATEVLKAAVAGRVEEMAVLRDAEIRGTKCRECENVVHGTPKTCQVCGSASVFEVDLVDEMTRQVALHAGETDFTDPLPGLEDAGGVAALLRY